MVHSQFGDVYENRELFSVNIQNLTLFVSDHFHFHEFKQRTDIDIRETWTSELQNPKTKDSAKTKAGPKQNRTMERAIVLAILFVVVSSQPITESQRLFAIAVRSAGQLHFLSQSYFSEFENSLGPEEQRQLIKVFQQDFCNSDYITSPINKHETQRSSVLKLLQVSYRMVESWEQPSRSMLALSRNQIPEKLSDLKTGLELLIRANQEADGVLTFGPFEDYRQRLSPEQSVKRVYELLACFKKDMNKVETYLMVAKCRLSPEANCTL